MHELFVCPKFELFKRNSSFSFHTHWAAWGIDTQLSSRNRNTIKTLCETKLSWISQKENGPLSAFDKISLVSEWVVKTFEMTLTRNQCYHRSKTNPWQVYEMSLGILKKNSVKDSDCFDWYVNKHLSFTGHYRPHFMLKFLGLLLQDSSERDDLNSLN